MKTSKYCCCIVHKRCLITKVRDSLYKNIEDKVLGNEGNIQNKIEHE